MSECQFKEREVTELMVMFFEYLRINVFGMTGVDGSSYSGLQSSDGGPVLGLN